MLFSGKNLRKSKVLSISFLVNIVNSVDIKKKRQGDNEFDRCNDDIGIFLKSINPGPSEVLLLGDGETNILDSRQKPIDGADEPVALIRFQLNRREYSSFVLVF